MTYMLIVVGAVSLAFVGGFAAGWCTRGADMMLEEELARQRCRRDALARAVHPAGRGW